MKKLNKNYPFIFTRGAVIFPSQELIVEVGRSTSVKAVNYALENNLEIVLACQKDLRTDAPNLDDAYMTATVCRIKTCRRSDDHLKVTFLGVKRCKLVSQSIIDGVNFVEAIDIYDVYEDSDELEILGRRALTEFNLISAKYGRKPFAFNKLLNIDGSILSVLVDNFAKTFVQNLNEKISFLEENDVLKRCELMLSYIDQQTQLEKIEKEITEKVKEKIDETQRDYFLREKMRAIKEELGDTSPGSDIDDLKEKLENNPYPEHVKEKVREEIKRYEMTPQASGESGVIRNYIEWVLSIPWYEKSQDNDDLDKAQQILDEDHYGLDKVKERILEYLAVKQMTSSLKSPILCLIGPPGVGKTSLAKSVARALDRKFVKMSLGGVRDEAEIRGHRKTYLGSMPGRIIQGMKRAGTTNPVFLIDEIDKMASDFKGDPSSAMLEVLDPEQNTLFSDHYIEEPYDLSDVLFIATANYAENIPAALWDRLEIIDLNSYSEVEKLNIATKHLLAKQREANGLKPSQISIDEGVLLYIIRHYTREAGVRQLERTIGTICRKTALEILKNKKKSIKVSKKLINGWLGHEKYDYGMKDKKDQVGVVNGLAYTSFGGDILPIEVNHFEGKGKFIVTGQLGDVMKESTEIALDYIKANAVKFKIDPKFFEERDIHIHAPAGAVPKDGPSAGVTLTTALVSAILNKPVKCDIAMTGEVTLRGNVLPIGGLKEKSMAAHRAGVKKIYIPKDNVKDLDEVADVVKESIQFVPVEKVDQIIAEVM